MRAIISHERVFASPPPAPAGTSLREWFAGLALGNPELMKDINPSAQIQESLRIADDLIGALAAPKTPSLESMAAPSAEEMQRWDEQVASERTTKERQSRATVPNLKIKRNQTLMGIAAQSIPPGSIKPPALTSGMGRYQVVTSRTERSKGKKA